MSAEQNIGTARQMYEAFGRGDVQAILGRVTDDVDWSTDAAIPSAPWYGPRHGRDGVVSFFEAIGGAGGSPDSGDVPARPETCGYGELLCPRLEPLAYILSGPAGLWLSV